MKRLSFLLLAVAATLLSGCGASTEDELHSWMAEQRNQTRPRVAPLAEPTPFLPEDYTVATAPDPFSREKLTNVLKRDTTPVASLTSALIAPELKRRQIVCIAT